MSKIAQKIFELRKAIMEADKDAYITSISLSLSAERALNKQLNETQDPSMTSPAEYETYPYGFIRRIFGIPIGVGGNLMDENRRLKDDLRVTKSSLLEIRLKLYRISKSILGQADIIDVLLSTERKQDGIQKEDQNLPSV